jgi:hypothetical protein
MEQFSNRIWRITCYTSPTAAIKSPASWWGGYRRADVNYCMDHLAEELQQLRCRAVDALLNTRLNLSISRIS